MGRRDRPLFRASYADTVRRRRRVGVSAAVAVLLLALMAWMPKTIGVMRLGQVLLSVAVVFGLASLWLEGRRLAGAALALAAVLGAALILPGEAQKDELRASYVDALRGFEGAPYVWGGETSRGIDCSGLARRALLHTALADGVWSADGALLRYAARSWFFDLSAKAMRDGERDMTSPVMDLPNLRSVSAAGLLPGDLLTTANGLHVLIYLGGDAIAQADPTEGRVLLNHQGDANPWLDVPIRVRRWNVLAPDRIEGAAAPPPGVEQRGGVPLEVRRDAGGPSFPSDGGR